MAVTCFAMPPPTNRVKCFSCPKAHVIKTKVAYFKPVSIAAAQSGVDALGLPSSQNVEPWVNPNVNCSYAGDTHVLLTAPLPEGWPTDKTSSVTMCMAAYQRKGMTTHFLKTNLPGMRWARSSSTLPTRDAEESSTPSTIQVFQYFRYF